MTVELADPASVVIERRVEWPDTDAAGHQHHSVVMRWVEEAEAALLEPLGLSWPVRVASPQHVAELTNVTITTYDGHGPERRAS